MNRLHRVFMIGLCLIGLNSGVDSDCWSVEVPQKGQQKAQPDGSAEIDRLLKLARAADGEIAELRKTHLKMSEALTLPAEKDRPGAINWRQRMLDFRMRELAIYRKRTKDSPQIKAAVEEFLTLTFNGAVSGKPDVLKLEAMTNGLVANCRDPITASYSRLVRPFSSQIELLKIQRGEVELLIKRVPASDRGLAYDVNLRRVLIQINQTEGMTPPSRDQAVQRKAFSDSLVRFLELAPLPGDFDSAWTYANVRLEGLARPQLLEVLRHILQSPKVPDWYKLNVAIKALEAEGWEARGEGTADSVTDAGRKTFADKLEQARRLALLAWKMQPESPVPATHLEQLVGSGAQDEWGLRQWFQAAIHTDFENAKAYEVYIHFMQPKWGGSHEELVRFGRECVETKRLDTQVPEIGLRVFKSLETSRSPRTPLMANPDARDAIGNFAQQVLQAIQEKAPLSIDLDDCNEQTLVWLIESGNYTLAKTWREKCPAPFSDSGMANAGGRLDRSDQWIAVCTGAASEVAIPLAQALYVTNDFSPSDLPGFRQRIADIRKQDSSELAEKLCREMETIIGQYQTFESGQWVDFKFTPGMPGWQGLVAEEWKLVDEQTVTVQSDFKAILSPVMRFRAPYAVEVDVQPFDPAGRTFNSLAFLTVGLEWASVEGAKARPSGIAISPNLLETLAYTDMSTQVTKLPPAASRKLRIRVGVDDVECTVDGTVLGQAAVPGKVLTRIGFGSPPWSDAPTTSRFHQFRVQKLADAQK